MRQGKWLTLLASAICLTSLTASAQSPLGSAPLFDVYVASLHNLLGRQIIQTRDSGYITAGVDVGTSTSDIFVMRQDASGQPLWQNAYVSPGLDGDGWLVEQTDTGFVVVGISGPSMNDTGENLVVLSLDANGGVNWSRAYTAPPSSGFIPWSVLQTADGGFVVGADAWFLSSNQAGMFAMRLDRDGNIAWEKSIELPGTLAVATPDGGAVISGFKGSFGALTPVAVKLDGNGNVAWSKQYPVGTVSSYFNSMRPTADGGLLASGGYSLGTRDQALVMRLDANGNVTHQQAFGSSRCKGIDANDALPLATGGYLLEPILSSCISSTAYFAGVDAQDQVQWQESLAYPQGPFALGITAMTPTPDGSYIATGEVAKEVVYTYSMALKLDSTGSIGTCAKVQTASPALVLKSSPAAQVSDAAISVTDAPVSGVDAGLIPTPLTVSTRNGCRL